MLYWLILIGELESDGGNESEGEEELRAVEKKKKNLAGDRELRKEEKGRICTKGKCGKRKCK